VLQLLAWLSSIGTWKRAFITIVLGFCLLVALLSYKHEEQVFDALMAVIRTQPCGGGSGRIYMSPLYSDAQRQMNELEQAFQPNMLGVVAWRVDLETNRERMVAYAASADWRVMADAIAKERWQIELPVFGTNQVTDHLIGSIVSGRFACANAAEAWPALRRFPLAEICVIGVPPDEGNTLSGFIGGGWHDPMSPEEHVRAEAAFRSAASALVWHARQR